jgi:hypothetical protein
MLGCGALVLLLVAASLFGVKPRPRRDAATAAYLRICERLAALGLERRRGEGPLDYARRVAAVRPDLGAELQALTADYVALSYGSVATQQRGARLQRLRAFRPRRGTPSR